MGIEQMDDPDELPDELQSWQVITADRKDGKTVPKMLWKRQALSMILLFRQGKFWRVLDYDGPGLAVLDEMDTGWKEMPEMIPWEDAPEGLSVWEGDVNWGATHRGMYDEPDDPELVGEFRALSEEEWEAGGDWEDSVWDWRRRAVPYDTWRSYPVHLSTHWKLDRNILGGEAGSVCGTPEGVPGKWPDGHRHTKKRELVTCQECAAKLAVETEPRSNAVPST